jgi:hypothetical protein
MSFEPSAIAAQRCDDVRSREEIIGFDENSLPE